MKKLLIGLFVMVTLLSVAQPSSTCLTCPPSGVGNTGKVLTSNGGKKAVWGDGGGSSKLTPYRIVVTGADSVLTTDSNLVVTPDSFCMHNKAVRIEIHRKNYSVRNSISNSGSMYVGVDAVYPDAGNIGWANRAYDDSISGVFAETANPLSLIGGSGTQVVLNGVDLYNGMADAFFVRPLEGIQLNLNNSLMVLYSNVSGVLCDSCTITGDGGQTGWLYKKWNVETDSNMRFTPISGDWNTATSFTDSLGVTADIVELNSHTVKYIDGGFNEWLNYNNYTGSLIIGNSKAEKASTTQIRNDVMLTDIAAYANNAAAVSALGVNRLYYTDVAGEYILKITH